MANRATYPFAIVIKKAARFTIRFDPQGGTGNMPAVNDVKEGSIYTLPACGFVAPEGKQFAGWRIGTTQYKPGDKITVAATLAANKIIDVVAVWGDKPAPTLEPAPTPTPVPTPAAKPKAKPKVTSKSKAASLPKTGDANSAVLPAVIVLASTFGLYAATAVKKRSTEE